jgi:hypothetical protein
MIRPLISPASGHRRAIIKIVLTLTISVVTVESAFALIQGGTGNTPFEHPGWPKGASAIFNNPARIAWWEGPPFGGGQYHAEYRGDTQALNALLVDFGQLDVKTKRVIVRDGVGYSFWLNPNQQPEKQSAATMDWSCMFWNPTNWDRLRKLPADLNPVAPQDVNSGPPAELEVYAGGNIRWSDVVVAEGIAVVDERLQAHGFNSDDGVVLEGKVTDVASKQPLAARIHLQRVEPRPSGGYDHSAVSEATADDQGHWVLKSVPSGWFRIVADADGYVERVLSYLRTDEQPRWHFYEGRLSRPTTVAGHVIDDADEQLADVEVRLMDATSGDGGRYETPEALSVHTDAHGEFHLENVPLGSATVISSKSGYCRPGLGAPITTPKNDVELQMIRSGEITVTVRFSGTVRPEQYLVELGPKGGAAVGKWGGSASVDSKHQVVFKDIPPGRYVVHGHPNPSTADQNTDPIAVEVLGGQAIDLELQAR